MSDDFEASVKTLFEQTATTIAAPPQGFEDTVLMRGRKVRRTQRLQAVGGAVAAAALVIGAVGLGPKLISNGSPNTANNPTVELRPGEHTTPFDWAESLPKGDPSSAAFINDGKLFVDGTATTIRGAGVDPSWSFTIGTRVDSGWLFTATTPVLAPNQQIVSGVVSATGDVTVFDGATFPYYAPSVSPDGTQAVADDTVYDIATGDKVGSVPGHAAASIWFNAGIMYFPNVQSDRAKLWTPGSAPIDARIGTSSDLLGGWFIYRGPCEQTVGVLQSDGTIAAHSEVCANEGDTIVSISPSGRWEVLNDLDAIDLDQPADGPVVGDKQPLVPSVATDGSELTWADVDFTHNINIAWEDDDHIILALPDQHKEGAPDAPFDLVRCTVSTGECERAGDTVIVQPSEDQTTSITFAPLPPTQS